MALRIGQGLDVHRFTTGDSLKLGGVEIPFTQGIEAHSDGDVVLHALCDALLGALALGDIGQHFPDTDPTWKDCDSGGLLSAVMEKVTAAGFVVNNADITVVAQAPRLAPYILTMRESIADLLKINLDTVSVKATTTEKLGFCGREEGLAASAVVLLISA